MTRSKSMVILGVAAFVVGAAVGISVSAFGVLQGYKRHMDWHARANLQATASRAQLELRQLELLRSGQVNEVIDQLELLVDSHTISIGAYESAFLAAAERNYALRVLGEIDAYRDMHDATIEHPILRQRLDAALALADAKPTDSQ